MAEETAFSPRASEQTKQGLRRQLLARRAALLPGTRSRMSAAIATWVCSLPEFVSSHTIMVYMALPAEVQTAAIISVALRQGKRVVVPVVTGADLVVVEYPQQNPQFRRGPLGIMEPSQDTTLVADDEIDCVLVPGVGFDRCGARLGFGRGYYDRFLRRLSPTVRYGGLAFHSQIVACIPHMPHDVPMYFVVSEQGILSWERVLPGSQRTC